MVSESFLKRVLMFIGLILSGLITLIFVSTPDSLQVPVPDSVPSITTKSSIARGFEEAKVFFESSVREQVPRASVASVVSWSPNGKYIIANLRFIDPTGGSTKSYVLDLGRKKYVEVPNAKWIDTVSWSNNAFAYQTEKGYAYFDVATGETKTFGGTTDTFPPIISSDGSYIAYTNNGLAVFSIKTSKAIVLTQNIQDIPLLWKADDKTLVISTTDTVSTSSDGEMTKNKLAEFHIGTRAMRDIVALPQPVKQATWVAKNALALISLGADDGTFDYGLDFSNGNLSLIAETSEGIAFTGSRDGKIATLKGARLTLYGAHLEKISDLKRTSKGNIANFFLLPPTRALLFIEKDKGYDIATFDMETSVETVIKNIWLPYAVLSPTGKNAVTVNAGNDNVDFFDIQ